MEVIDKLVAEFIIRRQRNPRVSFTNLLSALKFGDSPDCLKLKVSSVLRDISDSLIRGTFDEGTLDLLEMLEKLLLQQKRSPLTESHKSAYCWMAAESTVRFMWPLSVSDGLFTDAVERIWTKRIEVLKESGSGLVSHELLKWETDMKMALEDAEVYQRIRESSIRYTAVSFLTQLVKEQWALLGSSALESVAQRRFLKRKAESNVEGDSVRNGGDPSAVDGSTRRVESDTVEQANEGRGSGEGENGDVSNMDVEGVVNEQHGADEERTMGAQEQEHESSLEKGDRRVARELKECLLEIQRQIDPSTRHVQEPNNAIDHSVDFNPQPARFDRTGTSSQDHNETRQDNVSEKGSGGQGTWSGRVRPHLLTPVPLNVYPLKKADSSVRRHKKFWTPEEVEALREGVKEYGKSWKDIKNANPAVFAERTEVDLKDKWRNLVR